MLDGLTGPISGLFNTFKYHANASLAYSDEIRPARRPLQLEAFFELLAHVHLNFGVPTVPDCSKSSPW